MKQATRSIRELTIKDIRLLKEGDKCYYYFVNDCGKSTSHLYTFIRNDKSTSYPHLLGTGKFPFMNRMAFFHDLSSEVVYFTEETIHKLFVDVDLFKGRGGE